VSIRAWAWWRLMNRGSVFSWFYCMPAVSLLVFPCCAHGLVRRFLPIVPCNVVSGPASFISPAHPIYLSVLLLLLTRAFLFVPLPLSFCLMLSLTVRFATYKLKVEQRIFSGVRRSALPVSKTTKSPNASAVTKRAILFIHRVIGRG